MPGPVFGPRGAPDALARQLEVQARIAGIAQTLLSLPPEELDQGIRDQLGVAAAIAGADRTRLVVANPRTGRVAAAYDWWTSPEAASAAPIESDMLRHYPWTRERIKRGEVVQISGADSLPDEASDERGHVEALGASCVLVVPIRIRGQILGGHIFVRLREGRPWSDDEVAILQSVTRIFASAFQRRQAEHALRESEQRFRAIAEHASELVSEIDHAGRYHYVSPSYTRHLGHTQGELLGKDASALAHPDDLDCTRRTFSPDGSARSEEVRSTHRLRHKDGSWLWFESTGGFYYTPNGSPRFVAISRHVSERVAMQEAMQRQLAAEQTIAALSRRFLAVSAQELDAAIREALAEAGRLGSAERVVLYTTALDPDPRGMAFQHEWCAAGIARHVGMRCPWSESQLEQGRILHFGSISELPPEATHERESWQRRGVRSMLVIPVRLEGELVGLIGLETQTHERRWSEPEIALLGLVGEILTSAGRRCRVEAALRESQARLMHAQKLEAVGRLAGGVAHDFNNLLSVILGFSRPLLRELPEGNPVRDDVREIHAAAERGAALTRQLLTFGRRQGSEPERVDLGAVLRGIEPLLARLLGDDVELVLELTSDLPAVSADPQQLEQVVINLAVNARDAMPDGGCFRLETSRCELTDDAPGRHRLPPGVYVRLAASDTGLGMDEETRSRIFEPFFTTKEPGKGTGLGLSIVYSVVEQAGGAIAVDAAPGKGSGFEILLPAVG